MQTLEDIRQRINDSLDKMPSLPTTVGKVIQLANDINSSAKDILAVIQLDPVITAKVLKLINSAFYGMPSQVSLKQAVVLLGINTIKNLALSSAIVGQMSQSAIKIKSFDQQRYWEHSLGTGIACKIICRKLQTDPKKMDEYFVAGLVHDIGKLILAQTVPILLAKSIQHAEANKLNGVEAENQVIGVDHAEVGSLLGERWSLDALLVDSIRYHHDPEAGHGKLTWVVHVANYLVHEKGYANTGEFGEARLSDKALGTLGLREEDLWQSLENLPEEIKKATVFLQT